MLNWLLGRQVEDANRDEDNLEIPETPAPVFAARALKSAIFGTPGFPDEDELEKPRQAIDMNGKIRPRAQAPGGSSPTKPQGILLTPGTATVRRKTVSFGAGVVDNEGKDAVGNSGVPSNCPGKFPSPYAPKTRVDDNLDPARRTALTKTLEAARDGNPKRPISTRTAASGTVTTSLELENGPRSATSSNTERRALDVALFKDPKEAKSTIHSNAIEDFEGDMTLDLNEPHSQSGRYWKSEYDRYHEEAKVAMEKLVKYKQLAKSYAKKKDSEAIDLGEKLKEEQQKVANMEAKMAELAVQIADRRLSGRADENHVLMKDLARQTALAREYGNRVDEFQAALEENHAQLDQPNYRRVQRPSSTSTARTLSGTGLELNRAREQLVEMGSMQDELHSLRLNLSAAEKKVSRLQDDNAKLAGDLTKVNEELYNSERCRESAEAQNLERHASLQALQKDYDTLKELAKSQRRDAEDLLKKRHAQVAKLKKEIKLLKGQTTVSTQETTNQVMSHAHGEITTYPKKEFAETGKPKRISHLEDLMSFDTTSKPEERSTGSQGGLHNNDRTHKGDRETGGSLLPRPSTCMRYDGHIPNKMNDRKNDHLLESKIPILGRSTERFGSAQREDTRKTDENIPERKQVISKHTTLSEIINSEQPNDSPARNPSLPASHLSPSFQERFSSLSLNSPSPARPSAEPSFGLAPIRRIQDKHCTDSPRPSMFNIPSSPPKQILSRPRSSGVDSHIGRNSNAGSSRVSSLSSKARITLPSDRAAAAKARLEQKSAEKRRAQEMDREKENIKP